MRNIAIVANTSFNIVNFRLPLMQFLQKQNYNVIAIAPKDEFTSKILEAGFKFIEIKKLSRKGTNPIQDLQLMFELKKIYQTEKIDIALQYTIKPNIYGSLAAKITSTKTICTVTGLGYTFLNKSIASTISKGLYKMAYAVADVVFFQNKDDKNIFVEKKLIDAKKSKIINGSGIDTERFNPEFCNNKENTSLTFLFIGRLLKDKGIFEFIEAAKIITEKYTETKFIIAGEIDRNNPSAISEKELNSILENKQIDYVGYVKDTRTIICNAACIVLPSYREGLPRVILEAMSMQKPCITTDVAGCRDAVDENCAFLAEVANSNSLAKQIEKFILLELPMKEKMGKNARTRAVTVFAQEIISKDYLAEILKLLNNN
jgi:glycosyltransferase involved in cell wall biosynthesis